MIDWLAILLACVLAALVGLGFVLWERHDSHRLARERLRRRIPRRGRPRPLDVDGDRRAA